jgi:hypothetical protein
MTGWRKIALVAAGTAGVLTLAAAQVPAALRTTSPGLWEITGAPGLRGPVRQCVADPVALAQFEHRGKRCSRSVITDGPSSTVIHYNCPGGEFGESKLTVITPRSLRIETQGISQGLPFNYVIQARRVGDCPGVATAAAH